MRHGLLDRTSLAKAVESLLACWQAIRCARHAPTRQYGQRATAKLAESAADHNPIMHGVMRLSAPSTVSDNGDLATSRALPGQPFGIILTELASIAGTWDKDDHG